MSNFTQRLFGVNLAGLEFAHDALAPADSEIDYFFANGMNTIRLPFNWERLQTSLYVNIDQNSTYFQSLKHVVDYASGLGMTVILDCHNYGRYNSVLIEPDGYPQPLAPASALQNLWKQIATIFKDNEQVVFGIMNEPGYGGAWYDAIKWLTIVNSVVEGIRNQPGDYPPGAGAQQQILISTPNFNHATNFATSEFALKLEAGLANPSNNAFAKYGNFAIELHQYFDSDGSGAGTDIWNSVQPVAGVNAIVSATAWARSHNIKLFLSETAVPPDAASQQALKSLVDYLELYSDVWQGMTYWGASTGFEPGYAFNISPFDNNGAFTGNKPQLATMQDAILYGMNHSEFFGTGGNDLIEGSNEADILRGGKGDDHINGRAGTDIVSYSFATGAVTLSLLTGLASGSDGNDSLSGIENVEGSAFDDFLTGDDFSNVLTGVTGDDWLIGNGGIDTADYLGSAGGVQIDLSSGGAQFTGGAGIDILMGIENVRGSQFNDVLAGDFSANVLEGLGGADELRGGSGDDLIIFDGADLVVNGGSGNDTGIFTGATTAQARAFDMIGNQIETLQWIYNGNDYNLALGAGNQRMETVSDLAQTEATFSERRTTLDQTGWIELVNILRDDGVRHIYDYDPSGLTGWQTILQVHAVSGLLDYTDTIFDNNYRVVRDEDQASANTWGYISTTYSSSGGVDYQDYSFDDGSRVIYDGDQDAQYDWTSISTTYAANAAVDYQDYIYDDGRRVIFDSDQASATPWSTRSTSYVAGDFLDVQDTVYDDGSRVIFDWDNQSAFYWSTFEIFYKGSGAMVSQRVTQDSGVINTYYF